MSAVSSNQRLQVTNAQFEAALEELGQFVAIPSVSNPSSPYFKPATLQAAAEFVGSRLINLGFDTHYHVIDGSAPFVLAQKIVDIAKPTLLLYAHYDVQPVEEDKWNTPCFVMVQKGERLYGRGASDDKAGVISIITALRAFQEAGRELPVNIRILVEGGEEYDSDTKTLVAQQAARLDAQAMVILDGANRDVDTGTMENSTRGIVTLAVKMTALDKPTHSGVGCLVPDPAQALAKLITALENPRAIPGLLDDCIPLTAEEKRLLAQSSVTPAEYAKEHGVKPGAQLRGDPQESIFERTVQEPSISVINMNCGQVGGGNSIQDAAQCKIGIRLTPGQDPARVSDVMIRYLRSQAPMWNVQLEAEQKGLAARAWKADLTGPFSTAFMASLKDNYPNTAVMPTGGTLPLIYDFLDSFPKMEVIIAGVEDPHTAAHSHNESQDIGVLRRTTDALIGFFERAAAIQTE